MLVIIVVVPHQVVVCIGRRHAVRTQRIPPQRFMYAINKGRHRTILVSQIVAYLGMRQRH